MEHCAVRGATLLTTSGIEPITDGLVTIRPPGPGDAAVLIAGRDAAFHRWLGAGADVPQPVACIVVAGEIVGWVDYDIDPDHDWLEPGEVNVGYNVFAAARGNGYATRAVELLLQHLARDTDFRTATLLIDPDNDASLAVAERARFKPRGVVNGSRYFSRAVPGAGRAGPTRAPHLI